MTSLEWLGLGENARQIFNSAFRESQRELFEKNPPDLWDWVESCNSYGDFARVLGTWASRFGIQGSKAMTFHDLGGFP